MSTPRFTTPKIKINQSLSGIEAEQVEACGALILVLPESALNGRWPAFPHRDVLQRRLGRLPSPAAGKPLLDTHLPSDTRVVLAFATHNATAFERLTLARKLAQAALADRPNRLAIAVPGLAAGEARAMREALTAAVLAACAALPSYQQTAAPAALKQLDLLGLKEKIDLRQTLAEAEGNHLARWLTALPPNALRPAQYLGLIRPLARREGWTLRFLDQKALAKQGAGAFLAVTQAGPRGSGIVHLQYRPKKATEKTALALVGKGICFDTGGMNLKPARYMHGMHQDMAGSATAFGTLLALTRLKVDFPVDCWLALAENHIGELAYRQGDVVRAANGTSIEVVHTDAEGRMVLADTLTFASRARPGLIIDYATLTGSCVTALGSRYSGACSNRDALHPVVIEAGRACGERVWPFPTDEDYESELDSRIADIKQCTLESGADHILAARFLQRFIEHDTPWLHIDMSAGEHKGGLAHIPSDITGFGVRFSLNLVLQQGVLRQQALQPTAN